MKFGNRPSRMLIVLVALSALLPVLAALQYYWLGQVSQGASERLESTLRTSATQFRHDFNRELIRAYLTFLIDPSSPPDDLASYHTERWHRWEQTAPNSRLISDVFVVSFDEQGQPRLSHLNPTTGRLDKNEWVGEFASLRDRFVIKRDGSSTSRPSLESFAEEIPALLIPFPFQPAGKESNQTPPLPNGFTIVKLDLKYLQTEFIPALVQRHFFGASHTDYDLAIVRIRDPKRMIYSTRPAADFSTSDVSLRILGLESDEIRAFLHSEGEMATGPKQPVTRTMRLINLTPPTATASGSSPEDGHWRLQIRHHAGSLAAAVSSARRRNLVISFGILVLLAAGIFMTVLSTWRAQRLAQQQINFVAGVTHELRTPLAVICSAGENLADGIVDHPGKAAHYGRVIHTEGRRLAEMIEQVLEFAGAHTDRPLYQFRSTDMANVVAGAIAACQTQMQEKNFAVETLIDQNLPGVQGDEAALKRAVQNLIGNAIKYDSRNRWVRISAHASTGKRLVELQIIVEDRGPGISSNDIGHIFEPFYRGQDAIASQIEGSGIGLSLVKQIIEAHGGKVTVKSIPGMGSAFTLHLPVDSEGNGS
ncbi:MAG: sensor histidine kinase [Pyrinomonadaceae bacterium]